MNYCIIAKASLSGILSVTFITIWQIQESFLFVKAWVLTQCQHTVCKNTPDWKTFRRTIPPIFHSSRVNIIYGVESRFFHCDPQMKELILRFLPLSLTHSPSHQRSSQPSLWLTLGQMDVTLSIFYLFFFQSVRNRLLKPRLYLHGNPLIVKYESWDCLHSFWSLRGSFSCWGECHCCTHMTHMSHTCTHRHTYCEQGGLSILTAVCEAVLIDSREMTLAGEYTELSVWANFT